VHTAKHFCKGEGGASWRKPSIVGCPGFSWDRVNFPPDCCCVLDLVQEEFITLMFSVVAMKSRTFFQFLIFSSGVGVQELGGSTARQIAQLANGNIPRHRRHA